jgi:hypothetical protein
LLSVRGLAFNLGYGSVSLGFSLLLARMRMHHGDDAFRAALLWQLPAVAVVIALFFVWAWRGRSPTKTGGDDKTSETIES